MEALSCNNAIACFVGWSWTLYGFVHWRQSLFCRVLNESEHIDTKHLFCIRAIDRPFRSWHTKESSSQQNKRWKWTLAHFVHHCSRRQLLLRHREFQISGSTEGLPSDSFTSPIWFAYLPCPGHTASCKASSFRRPPRVTVVYNKLSLLEFLRMMYNGTQ